MKGIILAGGNGTRLAPLTKVTNKHLLPIYDKPMIYYPLEVMRKAGIENILIVSGKGHSGHFLNLLGSGKEFGARLSYEVQEEAGGIAQALGLAEDFADGENIAVILGDNVFQDNLASAVKSFDGQKGAKIFLKQVHDPHRFGVAEMRDGKILSIEEKARIEESKICCKTFLYKLMFFVYKNYVNFVQKFTSFSIFTRFYQEFISIFSKNWQG